MDSICTGGIHLVALQCQQENWMRRVQSWNDFVCKASHVHVVTPMSYCLGPEGSTFWLIASHSSKEDEIMYGYTWTDFYNLAKLAVLNGADITDLYAVTFPAGCVLGFANITVKQSLMFLAASIMILNANWFRNHLVLLWCCRAYQTGNQPRQAIMSNVLSASSGSVCISLRHFCSQEDKWCCVR